MIKLRIVLSLLFSLLLLLTACQTGSAPYNPDVDFDTTASTPDKADLGNRVWLDTNGDGVKQTPENGFRGITVNLWTDTNNDGVPEDKLASQVTDAGGFYRFNGIDADINYILQVEAPNGFVFSPKNSSGASTKDRDSDINTNGFSDSLDLDAGRYNYFTDAALTAAGGTPPAPIKLSRLGNRIWNDSNGDGFKQGNERGFKGVTVNLWIDNNKDNTPDSIIKTDVTDNGGFYFFNALDSAQQYFLQLDLPEDYVPSPKNNASASSIDKDSDFNANGITDALNLKPLIFTYWIDGGLNKGNIPPVNDSGFEAISELALIASGINELYQLELRGDQLAIAYDKEEQQNQLLDLYTFNSGSWENSFTIDGNDFVRENGFPLVWLNFSLDKSILGLVACRPGDDFDYDLIIYEQTNEIWQEVIRRGQQDRLDQPCASVRVRENTFVHKLVSQPVDNVFVFEKTNGTWQQTILLENRANPNLGLSEDTIVTQNFRLNKNIAIRNKIDGEWRKTFEGDEFFKFTLANNFIAFYNTNEIQLYEFDGQVWNKRENLILSDFGFGDVYGGREIYLTENNLLSIISCEPNSETSSQNRDAGDKTLFQLKKIDTTWERVKSMTLGQCKNIGNRNYSIDDARFALFDKVAQKITVYKLD